MSQYSLFTSSVDRLITQLDTKVKLALLVILTAFAVWIAVSPVGDSEPRANDQQEKPTNLAPAVEPE